MAFFKLRKDSGEHRALAQSAQSLEAVRQRAKHRLVGASILVVTGVVVFPLLFDKQPRPLPADTPIVMAQKTGAATAPPLNPPVALSTAPVASGPVKTAEPQAAAPEPIITETREPEAKAPVPGKPAQAEPKAVASDKSSQAPVAPTLSAQAPSKPSAKPAAPDAAAADAKRAQALLEGRPVAQMAQAAEPARFVVQVGAFAESGRAQDVRNQIERSGLKTYTQVAQTKEGPRIRVRVGPFGQKADAEKAAEQIRKLNLPTAILSL